MFYFVKWYTTVHMKQVLVRYITSQLILTAVVILLSWIILSLLGVAYPLLLEVLAGTLSVVPFFGLMSAAVIAALVAIFDAGRFLPLLHPAFEGLAILIVFFFLNQLTDFVLSPLLVGSIVRINPFLLIASVLVATLVFGPLGAILATPVLIVIKTVLEEKRSR